MEQADREGEVETRRLLQAHSRGLLANTGVEVPREPRDAWMASMRFATIDDKGEQGQTPLLYAVLVRYRDSVRALSRAVCDTRATPPHRPSAKTS